MSLAAVRELRRLNPERPLVLAARPWVSGLFREQQLVDEILELSEGAGPWAESRALRQARHRPAQAVLFPNSFATALATWLAGIPRRAGYGRDGRGWMLHASAQPRIRRLRRHQVYYYLDLLYQTGLSSLDYLEDRSFRPDIGLRAPDEARRRAETLLEECGAEAGRPRVALNPGAFYGPAKRWFADRYALLADALIEEAGVQVLLIGSAGEKRLAEEIRGQMRRPPVLLTGKTDLTALLGVLKSCRLLITNDSGPMHLAAALDVPQVALFGSTDAVATGPLGPRARVVQEPVPCSPCLLRECPLDLRCFERITVERVTREALDLLAAAGEVRK